MQTQIAHILCILICCFFSSGQQREDHTDIEAVKAEIEQVHTAVDYQLRRVIDEARTCPDVYYGFKVADINGEHIDARLRSLKTNAFLASFVRLSRNIDFEISLVLYCAQNVGYDISSFPSLSCLFIPCASNDILDCAHFTRTVDRMYSLRHLNSSRGDCDYVLSHIHLYSRCKDLP